MTSAAIIPHLTRPHLVPRLSHRQYEAILVEHLEREWSIGHDFRHETRVRIAVRVQDGNPIRVILTQRDFAQYSQALARVIHKMIPIIVRATGIWAIAAMRVWFHREDPNRVNVTVPITAILRTLIFPVAALAVFRCVECVESVVKVSPRRNHARETLSLVK